MQDRDGAGRPGNARSVLTWTLQVSAAVCLGALVLTHYLARATSAYEAPTRDAGPPRIARGQAEPETTGALGSLRGTRLDPCALR